jgi:pilus assembly protein CpaC
MIRGAVALHWTVALCAALLLLLPEQVAAEQSDPLTISLQKGVEKFVTVNFLVRRLSIGDPKVADVSVIDGDTLRVLGLVNGRTTFSLWREGSQTPTSYTVVVAPDITGLQTRLSSDPAFDGAHLSEVDGKVVLSGTFKTSAAQSRARAIAKYAAGGDILDLSQLAAPEAVQVDVEVITVSRSALRELGLNFSALGSGFSLATSPPNTLRSYSFNTSGKSGLDVNQAPPIADAFNLLLGSPRYNVLAVISALQNADYAETLAQPTLVVRSGEKANFLVGGEVPIPVPQGSTTNAITIQYKRFGVSLSVEPDILNERRIALKIKPSVSELDYTNAVALDGFSVPALRTRETETTVEVNAGEPLLLAGLNFDSGSTSNERVPFLGDIPVIGEFFKRRSETHEEQELIVAVTPHIITPATQDHSGQNRVEKDYMELSSKDGAALGLHFDSARKPMRAQP